MRGPVENSLVDGSQVLRGEEVQLGHLRGLRGGELARRYAGRGEARDERGRQEQASNDLGTERLHFD